MTLRTDQKTDRARRCLQNVASDLDSAIGALQAVNDPEVGDCCHRIAKQLQKTKSDLAIPTIEACGIARRVADRSDI